MQKFNVVATLGASLTLSFVLTVPGSSSAHMASAAQPATSRPAAAPLQTPPLQPTPRQPTTQASRLAAPPAPSSSAADRLRPPPPPPAATSQPSPADQLLNQMLRPSQRAGQPIRPAVTGNLKDVTTGDGAAAPEAPQMPLLKEGTFLVDRTGRLTRSNEGTGLWEFTFDADGRTLRDPPVLLLPNSRLQSMEDKVRDKAADVRFRITGVVTTYRGRNGLLLEKVTEIPEITELNPL